MPAATATNRVSNFWSGYKWGRENFGHKLGNDFGKRATHLHPIFLGVPLGVATSIFGALCLRFAFS